MRSSSRANPAVRLLVAGTVALGGLAGCTSGADESFSNPTAPPNATASTSQTGVDPSATTSAPPPVLPSSCAGMVLTVEVDKALAMQLPGTAQFVVGEPEPQIKRIARVTCSFGVVAGQPVPLQASLFVYADAQSATDRVKDFLNSSRSAGSTSRPTKIGSTAATIVADAKESTIIFPIAEQVYSITLVVGVVAAGNMGTVLVKLGTAMRATVGA